MELTEEQKQEIKQKFKVRRTRQMFISLPFVAVMLGFIAFEDQMAALSADIPEQVLGIGFFVAVLAVLGLSFRNWRCPQCDGYLGKNINPKFCSKCGAALQ
ncbi:MAG: hypothetical protein KC900_07170 [Candidatus Omnitrophica bacterium]|nr:hypothetical protein [Candidatus Omnitrophota bacterium]